MVFLVQLAGCFWRVGSDFNLQSNKNWLRSKGIMNASLEEQYIASLYWSVVTCTTVGYGDILPTNGYELFWGMIIIVIGVAVFSFVLGDLASQFSELLKSNNTQSERLE
jgi:hypothetical protein